MQEKGALEETNFNLTGQTGFYRGKVRDVYEIQNQWLVMIASDRISAFDHILPEPIAGKGAILNTIAAEFLEMTRRMVPNWLVEVPDGRVSIGLECKPYPIEMVIRGYLCGHALREYNKGKRTLSGQPMADGMKPYQEFTQPIITPATKAQEGHDMDITPYEIVSQGLMTTDEFELMSRYTRELFKTGQEYARSRGLILADTKYEFGRIGSTIYLIDEIHTPDSSRYFYAEGYDEHVLNGTTPRQLSKEFVREWLMEKDFQGLEGQKMPDMSSEVVEKIKQRYLELYKKLMGRDFDENSYSRNLNDLEQKINKGLMSIEK
jgi:phosphoribosylaminoimidazole-succinocarboxamide synthase